MDVPPNKNLRRIELTIVDFHPHLNARMHERGVTKDEVEKTLKEGDEAVDAKSGTEGKVLVFPYNSEWEGKTFAEKEVTVYYKVVSGKIVMLTVKARYGKAFVKGGGGGANRI